MTEFLRSLVTLAVFAAFVGVLWWAYAPSRRNRFEAQGRSILDESDA